MTWKCSAITARSVSFCGRKADAQTSALRADGDWVANGAGEDGAVSGVDRRDEVSSKPGTAQTPRASPGVSIVELPDQKLIEPCVVYWPVPVSPGTVAVPEA